MNGEGGSYLIQENGEVKLIECTDKVIVAEKPVEELAPEVYISKKKKPAEE